MTAINIKTQTKRATSFKKGYINVNLFCENFEVGITTSESWGDFSERKETLIEMRIEGKSYAILLNRFKEIIKKNAVESD